jgi:fluoride exporter
VSWWVWLGVALLGGVGANARFLVHSLVASRFGEALPLGTLAINVSGSLLLGLLAGLSLSGNALVLAGTATLGSYTTFSTWMLDTWRLGEEGGRVVAALNVVVSVGLGLGAVALGRLVGEG